MLVPLATASDSQDWAIALILGAFIVVILWVAWHVGKRPSEHPASDVPKDGAVDSLKELLWLGDAPLFIDEARVEAFYDAILRPETELIEQTEGQSVTSSVKSVGGVGIEQAVPGLFKVAISGSQEHERVEGETVEAKLRPVSNPSRHLYALALHYASAPGFTSRLLLGGPDELRDGRGERVPDWSQDTFTSDSPRALAILDLPPGTMLMPMAFELTGGGVVPIYKELGRRLGKATGRKPPNYPGTSAPLADRNKYFKWFADNFSSRIAMETLEQKVETAKLAWLDFRVPFGKDPVVYVHLSLAPMGKYPTGVFGYQFIRRGTKHGVRIVGTLKSEPDVNVLAVFER